ncbi:hypothetical protein D0Z06_24580 [Geodermatophilus marinus]|nr:hypothetical protein D0Z06_24580 [Geodermatophilus sp. LHW52908]
MGYWKRHKRKDLEEVLEVFHQAGWLIEDPPTYYTLKCPCGKHMRWLHLTPSGANYGRNALAWGRRQPCWREGL